MRLHPSPLWSGFARSTFHSVEVGTLAVCLDYAPKTLRAREARVKLG